MGSQRVAHDRATEPQQQWVGSKIVQCINYTKQSAAADCFSHVQLCTTLQTKPARLLCPQDFLGKSLGVGCHALLQLFLTHQGSNLDFLYCKQILYHWATRKAHKTIYFISSIPIILSHVDWIRFQNSNPEVSSFNKNPLTQNLKQSLLHRRWSL